MVIGDLCRGERPWPLYLWSRGPGTGKTSAALVLLDWCGPERTEWACSPEADDLAHGFGDFAALPGVIRQAERGRLWWRSPGHGGELTEPMVRGWVRNARLLVLDDVRRPGEKEQTLGDDHYGLLKRVLDERVGRPLMLTANLCPWEPPGGGKSDLERAFCDRVADRVTGGTVFELGGVSRRG